MTMTIILSFTCLVNIRLSGDTYVSCVEYLNSVVGKAVANHAEILGSLGWPREGKTP